MHHRVSARVSFQDLLNIALTGLGLGGGVLDDLHLLHRAAAHGGLDNFDDGLMRFEDLGLMQVLQGQGINLLHRAQQCGIGLPIGQTITISRLTNHTPSAFLALAVDDLEVVLEVSDLDIQSVGGIDIIQQVGCAREDELAVIVAMLVDVMQRDKSATQGTEGAGCVG